MCMATQVSSFSLSDDDGTSWVVMKLAMSNKGKREIVTTSCCFKKCGDNECVSCKASSDGSTPCIAWMASCAALRSKYGTLFFLIHFFPKGLSSVLISVIFLFFFFFPCPFFQKFHVLKSFFQKLQKHLMLKRKRKKKKGYNKYLCFLCNACWVSVGGREWGKNQFDIIAYPNFGPIQRFFLKKKLNERNGPKILKKNKLKKLLDFYGMF